MGRAGFEPATGVMDDQVLPSRRVWGLARFVFSFVSIFLSLVMAAALCLAPTSRLESRVPKGCRSM